MKQTCVKCGIDLEVEYGFKMKECAGLGFVIDVEQMRRLSIRRK